MSGHHTVTLTTGQLEALCQLFTFGDAPESYPDVPDLASACEVIEAAYYAHVAAEYFSQEAVTTDATG